jgi:hypothetical protein
MLTEYPEII